MAEQCLPPRLGHFKRTLPQVSLNFVRYQHAHDFATPHEFDAAIQYGYGNWPSANARYLIGKETSIVCSPQLRDTLLPKLISGELRVPDAEAFLGERGL